MKKLTNKSMKYLKELQEDLKFSGVWLDGEPVYGPDYRSKKDKNAMFFVKSEDFVFKEK